MRGLLLLLAVLLALPLAAAAPATAATGPRPGMVVDLPVSDAQIAALKASGAKTARMFAFETNAPRDFDDTVARLRRAGIRPELVLVGDPAHPPVTRAGIAAFVRFAQGMARRFRHAVGFEIWNEEDAPGWWAGMPPVDGTRKDAGPYVRLLKRVYPALKRIDRHVPVVVGGTTGNDFRFVASIYRHGGRGSFDAVATHTDTACSIVGPGSTYRERDGHLGQFTFPSYRDVHRVMLRHHDRKPIWMTELGWSTTTAPCDAGRWAGRKPGGVSEARQAAFVRRALARLRRTRYVTQAILFRLSDVPGGTPHDDFGVLRVDGSRKPAFQAFRAYARSR